MSAIRFPGLCSGNQSDMTILNMSNTDSPATPSLSAPFPKSPTADKKRSEVTRHVFFDETPMTNAIDHRFMRYPPSVTGENRDFSEQNWLGSPSADPLTDTVCGVLWPETKERVPEKAASIAQFSGVSTATMWNVEHMSAGTAPMLFIDGCATGSAAGDHHMLNMVRKLSFTAEEATPLMTPLPKREASPSRWMIECTPASVPMRPPRGGTAPPFEAKKGSYHPDLHEGDAFLGGVDMDLEIPPTASTAAMTPVTKHTVCVMSTPPRIIRFPRDSSMQELHNAFLQGASAADQEADLAATASSTLGCASPGGPDERLPQVDHVRRALFCNDDLDEADTAIHPVNHHYKRYRSLKDEVNPATIRTVRLRSM